VHQADDGRLAVVAVLAAEGQTGGATNAGATNSAWAAFIDAAAGHGAVGSSSFAGTIDFAALLPASLNHFAYDGGLTTPPCSENVRWLVMEEAVQLSGGQLEKLRAVHSGNNRPVQPVNARKVLLVNQ
jgi:carbonic anhydrase